jgi:predicted NUDIX family NTP pyrophosphohydrolase
VFGLLKMKERRPAFRTIEGWARLVLLEAAAIRECEEHGWMRDRADPYARREFLEETGIAVAGPLEPLGDIRQRGGKRVTAFAVKGDFNVDALKSNTFEIEWPPKSGKLQSFPEIDRAAWFELPAAHVKILESQRSLLDRLVELVNRGAKSAP